MEGYHSAHVWEAAVQDHHADESGQPCAAYDKWKSSQSARTSCRFELRGTEPGWRIYAMSFACAPAARGL